MTVYKTFSGSNRTPRLCYNFTYLDSENGLLFKEGGVPRWASINDLYWKFFNPLIDTEMQGTYTKTPVLTPQSYDGVNLTLNTYAGINGIITARPFIPLPPDRNKIRIMEITFDILDHNNSNLSASMAFGVCGRDYYTKADGSQDESSGSNSKGWPCPSWILGISHSGSNYKIFTRYNYSVTNLTPYDYTRYDTQGVASSYDTIGENILDTRMSLTFRIAYLGTGLSSTDVGMYKYMILKNNDIVLDVTPNWKYLPAVYWEHFIKGFHCYMAHDEWQGTSGSYQRLYALKVGVN